MFSLLGKRMFPWYNVGVKLGQIHPFISNTMRINYSRTVVVSLIEKKCYLIHNEKKNNSKNTNKHADIYTRKIYNKK